MELDLEKFNFTSTKVLENLSTPDRKKLEAGIQKKRIKAGKIIYREGSTPKGVFILKKGKVKIYQSGQDGRRQIIYIYSAGEMFGFRPIISNEPHPVTAAALEDCFFDYISREHFNDCLQSSSELCYSLLVALSHEFTVWVNSISVFAQYPVKSRVALALLVLKEKYKVKGKGGDINLSRTDLASYLGTVKESVVRVLQDFKKKKLVETQGRKIKLLKPAELKAIAEFY
jgi:CRP-like cAMP-binding protein